MAKKRRKYIFGEIPKNLKDSDLISYRVEGEVVSYWMTWREYKIHQGKEKLRNGGRSPEEVDDILEELFSLKWQDGYENGYESGYCSASD
jgi:hypothetical protein